jgi:RNA polymerase sigma-70 factor, ECF subfamily
MLYTKNPINTRASLLLRLRESGKKREIAWEEFYQMYAPVIAGFARKTGLARQDVSDVVQEVLLGFFSASPEFVYDPSRGRFRGYLKTCTWRIIQRRLAKRMAVSGTPVEEIASTDPTMEQVWDELWESEKLRRAMEMVREKCQQRVDRARNFQAFEMFTLLGRPAKEVAEELAISVDSVHQAKRRITSAIKSVMQGLLEEEG